MHVLSVVKDYEIKIKTYNGQVFVALSYTKSCCLTGSAKVEETDWMTASEASNAIQAWKRGSLLGSFAIGTILAKDADYHISSERT